MNVAVIIVAGSGKQNTCFWPTYHDSEAGMDHDLIVVHRNMAHVPNNIINRCGMAIMEDKIFSTGELPHKAFGAYRHYWYKYKDEYDFFAFISDDVLIKADGWLLRAISMLNKYDRLGWVGTQIFNGNNNQYPHPSHCRAPAWFAKSSALKDINWIFNSDHEGELRIADQFVEAGYFGAQVGNKIDVAYDALENGGRFDGDHVSSILASNIGLDLRIKLSQSSLTVVNNKFNNMLASGDDSLIITSPFPHIGSRRVISQIQPFHGLLYDKGEHLAPPEAIQHHNFGIKTLKDV